MLKIFNKNGQPSSARGTENSNTGTDNFRQLKEIASYFPIGVRIRYSPEFKDDIALESLIIAYAINGDLYYSNSDIQWLQSSQGPVLRVVTEGKKNLYRSIDTFQFIIPVGGSSEEKLDYARKESLGRNSGLVSGNNITLMAEHQQRRMPVLQTTVTHRTTIRKGFYAHQQVALLAVDITSLQLEDQRKNNRLQTSIPAIMRINQDSDEIPCQLADFCEHSARVTFDEQDPAARYLTPEQAIILVVNLPESHKVFTLRGLVFRRDEGQAVVSLSDIKKSGRFSRLDVIDSLEIKTLLLQHSQTSSPAE